MESSFHSETVHCADPVASHAPSVLQAKEYISSSGTEVGSWMGSRLLLKSQTRMLPVPTAANRPSTGFHETDLFHGFALGKSSRRRPEIGSHKRTPVVLPVASFWPSGLHATQSTLPCTPEQDLASGLRCPKAVHEFHQKTRDAYCPDSRPHRSIWGEHVLRIRYPRAPSRHPRLELSGRRERTRYCVHPGSTSRRWTVDHGSVALRAYRNSDS